MKTYLTILLLLVCGFCTAQNLIPNGDFEENIGCPMYLGHIDSIMYWLDPMLSMSGSISTPDYHNGCSEPFSPAGVPENNWGFQEANSGMAYTGILLYLPSVPDVREYIEVPLTHPLEQDKCYTFEMHVNLGDECMYTSDDIHVYFSDSLIVGFDGSFPLPFVPQISNASNNTFNDQDWTLVSGEYTAQGGESYLMIGNFKPDSQTNIISQNPDGVQSSIYTYIDDVSLVEVPCLVGINEKNSPSVSVYPNPFVNELTIELSSNELTTLIIYDNLSRPVLRKVFRNSTTIITGHLSSGVYFYEVWDGFGVVKYGKVIRR